MLGRNLSEQPRYLAARRPGAVRDTLYLAVALCAVATPAHAYIDPGSASIALQAIVGAIAAGAFTARLYWRKIKRFLGIRPKNDKSEGPGGEG